MLQENENGLFTRDMVVYAAGYPIILRSCMHLCPSYWVPITGSHSTIYTPTQNFGRSKTCAFYRFK